MFIQRFYVLAPQPLSPGNSRPTGSEPRAPLGRPRHCFAHAVRRGEVDEFVSAAFHADVMAILEAAQRSADSGQPVSVASVAGR
jgi:predicted dehydrogenase